MFISAFTIIVITSPSLPYSFEQGIDPNEILKKVFGNTWGGWGAIFGEAGFAPFPATFTVCGKGSGDGSNRVDGSWRMMMVIGGYAAWWETIWRKYGRLYYRLGGQTRRLLHRQPKKIRYRNDIALHQMRSQTLATLPCLQGTILFDYHHHNHHHTITTICTPM